MVHDSGFGIGRSLVGSTTDEIFAQLTPAATTLFSAVASATPAQLVWPTTPARAVDPRIEPCSSYLKIPALAAALGAGSIDDYGSQPDPNDPERVIYSIESVADRDAGFVHCSAEAGFDVRGSFTVALDNAAIVDRLASGISPTSALHLETLENLPATETAVSDCDTAERSSCQIWFSMGVDAVYVSRGTTDPKAVAEAIIAQAW